MLAFITIIATVLHLSTARAANARGRNSNTPDPDVQHCGRSWGDFANLGADRKACLNYGSAHYSCPADSCAIGQAPSPGEKSRTPVPLFSECAKYLGNFGDDTKLDPNKIAIRVVSYWIGYKNNTLRAIGYDQSLKTEPPSPLPGYSCTLPFLTPQVIEVCRNCTFLPDAKW
ncbi:uncharacterized protein MELLADRAFT_123280 [Melampsora larici-populina 98AG31]|uniref:Secreted protein n=1 Tax=Melampsora larici-populina (strain 98AG31 / pathotype 3-4-7) TaxID=747676 RepID=F4S343_MELLP|nr:uncharacterized protein MELLADRAFT_123280 [Melampsora larici-populina 98AG31]EGG00917.1 secreted protein [Melampsora larici-populina 98AG31]